MPGPLPTGDRSRDYDRDRHPAVAGPSTVLYAEEQVVIPLPEQHWTERVKRLWRALVRSPQAKLLTSADWEYAALACGELDAFIRGGYGRQGNGTGRSAMALQVIDSMISKILLLPAERARLRIYIEPRPEPGPEPPSFEELRAEIDRVGREIDRRLEERNR